VTQWRRSANAHANFEVSASLASKERITKGEFPYKEGKVEQNRTEKRQEKKKPGELAVGGSTRSTRGEEPVRVLNLRRCASKRGYRATPKGEGGA